jgi:hypothetical protein
VAHYSYQEPAESRQPCAKIAAGIDAAEPRRRDRSPDRTTSIREETMEPILLSDAELVEDTTDKGLLIHAWRAEQLRHLGFPHMLAETFAGLVDWHEIAALVARGCSPELALEIVR